MNEKPKKEEKIKEVLEIPVLIPSDSPKIYATGAFGGRSAHDFRIMLYSEEPIQQDELLAPGTLNVMREVKAQIYLPPLAAKQLSEWLNKQLDLFEKEIGPIPEPKKSI